jgi:hypothetical protein
MLVTVYSMIRIFAMNRGNGLFSLGCCPLFLFMHVLSIHNLQFSLYNPRKSQQEARSIFQANYCVLILRFCNFLKTIK